MKQSRIDMVVSRKGACKDTDRPKLQEMLDFAREGDTIYDADFSRLARLTKDLLELVELLESKGVQLVSIKENIDTSTAAGRLMLKMISAINDFEREDMLERQREGIAIVKVAGKYKGQNEVLIPDFDEQYERYMNREVSKVQLARELGVLRPTQDKLIKEHLHVTI